MQHIYYPTNSLENVFADYNLHDLIENLFSYPMEYFICQLHPVSQIYVTELVQVYF